MARIIDNQFFEGLKTLLENEVFIGLMSHLEERQMDLTEGVMRSPDDDAHKRGRACGIEWCRELPLTLINKYVTDQDTQET